MTEPTLAEQIAAVRLAIPALRAALATLEASQTREAAMLRVIEALRTSQKAVLYHEWQSAMQEEVAALAALDALPASAAPSEWRDISTAPKDGTLIDVWLGDASAADIEFYCTPGTKRSAGWQWLRDKWRPCVGGLQMPTFVVPTHWQPLPPPPTQPEGDKQ